MIDLSWASRNTLGKKNNCLDKKKKKLPLENHLVTMHYVTTLPFWDKADQPPPNDSWRSLPLPCGQHTTIILICFNAFVIFLYFMEWCIFSFFYGVQGCIISAILPSRMGAHRVSSEHMENMEMLSLFSNLGAFGFSENFLDIHCIFVEGNAKDNLFFLQTLLFMAFLVTVLKILTY